MDILQEIARKTRTDLELTRRKRPEEQLRAEAFSTPGPVRFRPALQPVAEGTPRIIAELKQASPSKGVIRKDFGVVSLGLELQQAGAAALSVLTETRYFRGSGMYLQTLARALSVPLLRKDFFVCEYQLYQAKVWGASAVLLIAALLSDQEFSRLHNLAAQLGLDVLAEVHTERELDTVLAAGARIVGVNSRDLKTFETSIETTAALLQTIPESVTAVAESGIHRGDDLKQLREAGADAFLIGESLMSSDRPGETLNRFLREGKTGA